MEVLQKIDWNIATPIFTFVLGVFVSLLVTYGKDFFDRKRTAKNIRTILFFETVRNHYLLSKLPSWKNDTKSGIAWAAASRSLEYSIFKEYLDRIDTLEPDELISILIAYSSIERTVKRGNDYLEYIKQNIVDREEEEIDNELLEMHSDYIHVSIENSRITTSLALVYFVEGRDDLMEKLESLSEEADS